VTHNMDLVAPTDRVVRLVKGRVEGAAYPGVAPSLQPLCASSARADYEEGEDSQLPSGEPVLDYPWRKAL